MNEKPPEGLTPRQVAFWWMKRHVLGALGDEALTERQIRDRVNDRGVTICAALYELESEGAVLYEPAGARKVGLWRRAK